MDKDKLSTTALAKKRGLDPKQLFSDLKLAGYINRNGDSWVLTSQGQRFGGEYVDHKKFGQFIVWPTNLVIDDNLSSDIKLSATQIGERFKISAKKVNQLLNELGWIDKDAQGWNVTGLGLTAGGTQKADATSKQRFVIWHESIVKNKRLKQTISEFLGKDAIAHSTDHSISSFRQKFEAKHRTLDGHYVHSTGELVIDNWLYMNGIVHAYNRPLPIEHDVVSDFYLPVGKVYLQYFATDSGAMTEEQITKIRMSYQGNGLNLIEVYLQDIDKLDEVLPKKLRKYGIKAY